MHACVRVSVRVCVYVCFLSGIGLVYVDASIWQMLRGSIVVFACLLSVSVNTWMYLGCFLMLYSDTTNSINGKKGSPYVYECA